MTSPANHARQPAGTPAGGQFTASAHGESGVVLASPDPAFFPAAPLTPRDVEHLVEHRGRFEQGYDSDDINRVLGRFEGARLVCVWEYFDDIGYGGSSDFAGIGRDAQGRDSGSWRSIHPDVWEFLSDPDSDVDPESIPSLLADEVFDGHDHLDALPGDGFSNVAPERDD